MNHAFRNFYNVSREKYYFLFGDTAVRRFGWLRKKHFRFAFLKKDISCKIMKLQYHKPVDNIATALCKKYS